MHKKTNQRIKEWIIGIVMFLITITSALASNYTTELIDHTFTSSVNLTITNSTIYVYTEGADITYPNLGGYDYTHNFDTERSINTTYNYFTTVDLSNGSIVCPVPIINLSCSNSTLNSDNITDSLQNYIETNLEPSLEELEECNEEIQATRDAYFELKDNASICFGYKEKYRSEAENWRTLYEQERDGKYPYYIIIFFLFGLLGFLILFIGKGGRLPFVWKNKPTTTNMNM